MLSSHVFPGKEVICGWQRYDAPGTEGVWKRLWARCVPVGMLPGAVLVLGDLRIRALVDKCISWFESQPSTKPKDLYWEV